MPQFIDPSGNSTFGLGVCARCWQKFPLGELHSDPNSPGLKVCIDDLDQYDPYRLPARKTENITLRFNRPDTDLTPGQPAPLPAERATPDGEIRVVQGGEIRVIQDDPLDGDIA